MHNDRVRKTWPFNSVPTAEELRRFDETITENVNGDDGGSWTPETPIILGGMGGTVYGTGGFSGAISTGERAASGGALVLGDGDYPTLSPVTTRTVLIGLRDFYTRRDIVRGEDNPTAPLTANMTSFPYDETIPGSIVNNSKTLITSHTRPTRLVTPILGRNLVHGSIVTDMRLRWRISSTTNLAFPPGTGITAFTGFRIIRIPNNGAYSNAASDLFHIPNWQATHAYALGELILPDTGPSGLQYRVLVAGTTPAAPPNWALHVTQGEIWQDGASAVYYQTEMGPSIAYGHFCTAPYGGTFGGDPGSITTYFNGGNAQDIVAPANCLTNTTIDLGTYSYVLEVYDPSTIDKQSPPDYVYHSLKMTLGGIALLVPTY